MELTPNQVDVMAVSSYWQSLNGNRRARRGWQVAGPRNMQRWFQISRVRGGNRKSDFRDAKLMWQTLCPSYVQRNLSKEPRERTEKIRGRPGRRGPGQEEAAAAAATE